MDRHIAIRHVTKSMTIVIIIIGEANIKKKLKLMIKSASKQHVCSFSICLLGWIQVSWLHRYEIELEQIRLE